MKLYLFLTTNVLLAKINLTYWYTFFTSVSFAVQARSAVMIPLLQKLPW